MHSRVVTTIFPCLVLCTMLGLLPGSASLTVLHFPDQNLEAVVREALGKPAGDITAEDMRGLTSLTAQARGIQNLAGLEHTANLQELFLRQNQISDLSPLAGLTNLRKLGLWQNQISDLSPLAGLTNLRVLYLAQNQVSSLSALAGLTNLEGLYVQQNQLSDLSPLAGLTNLWELMIMQNQVSDLSALAGLTNLQTLYLDQNQVSDLSPLAGLTTHLECLYLDQNQVSDLSPLAGLTNLVCLYLDQNQVSDLSPLAGLTNLQYLTLDRNLVSDISALVANSQAGGIGAGDSVHLHYNYLDLSEGYKAMTDIRALIDNGATVTYLPQLPGVVNEETGIVVAAIVALMVIVATAKPRGNWMRVSPHGDPMHPRPLRTKDSGKSDDDTIVKASQAQR